MAGDASAEQIEHGQQRLGLGDAGLGCLDEPAGGFLGVLSQAVAFGVENCQSILGWGDILSGGFRDPLGRL